MDVPAGVTQEEGHTGCECVFIKLHVTAQSGPFIYNKSFCTTSIDPPKGGISDLVCACILHINPSGLNHIEVANPSLALKLVVTKRHEGQWATS